MQTGTQQSCQVWGRDGVESGRIARRRRQGSVISTGSLSVLHIPSSVQPPAVNVCLLLHFFLWILLWQQYSPLLFYHPFLRILLYSLLVHSQICFLSTFSPFLLFLFPNSLISLHECPLLSAILSLSIFVWILAWVKCDLLTSRASMLHVLWMPVINKWALGGDGVKVKYSVTWKWHFETCFFREKRQGLLKKFLWISTGNKFVMSDRKTELSLITNKGLEFLII